jgi:hypothetical protein
MEEDYKKDLNTYANYSGTARGFTLSSGKKSNVYIDEKDRSSAVAMEPIGYAYFQKIARAHRRHRRTTRGRPIARRGVHVHHEGH